MSDRISGIRIDMEYAISESGRRTAIEALFSYAERCEITLANQAKEIVRLNKELAK